MINACFLSFIIILSVLLFGSIETWAFATVGIITVVFFNIWLYRNKFKIPESLWQRTLYASIIGFLAVCLFQVIPIPAPLLKLLSPSTYTLLKEISAGSLYSISFYRYATVNEILKLVVYIMIFITAASLSRDSRSLNRALAVLVIFGFILSFFAIIQDAAWNGKIYWFRELTRGGSPFGPFVNRNHFAGFTGMVIPLGLGLALESRKMEKSLFYIFFSLIMTLGVFYSLSRGGIISLLLSTGFFIMLILIKGTHKKSRAYLFAFLSSLALYLLYLGISPVIDRFVTSGLSSETRLLVWGGTFKAFKDFFWLGTGLGTFRYVFPIYYPQGLQRQYHYAHNDYLQLLFETGIIGALFAAVFFISIIMAIVKCARYGKPSFIMSGLMASALYMLIHSIFDFNLHMPSNAIMFSAVLGMLYGTAGEKSCAGKGRVTDAH